MSTAAIAEALHAYLEPLAEEHKFSGAILSSMNGRILFSQGYGEANLELGVPNTPQTRFRIGSITKTFTSTAVMQLMGQGLIKLEDTIDRYFPDQQGGTGITIHHLLTHTSGIPSYTADPSMAQWCAQSCTPRELAERFMDRQLEFAPGERYAYSNSGYALLGLLIEQVSGLSYGDYLKKHIFAPAGMTKTQVDDPGMLVPMRAAGYHTAEDGALLNAPYFDISNAFAAGSILSTVEDMHLWDLALASDALLDASLKEQMFTPYAADSEQGYSYGYGWIIQESPYGRIAAHSGGIPGFTSLLMRFLETGVTLHVLSNILQDINPISQATADIIHKQLNPA
ncbi:serine hydrolase domain-containing protein [Paenibacillus tarimensis]|uniref:serine hydrolase domain-containing protein n=1 Tax=Paenibacillus tarimensis TaxID=416012 RepID=UPI001F1AA512|nr:serine hydrolase domain-containing protein [Paenibacillus tarimensis]MCF2944381.1 beta-lactamase family protein [Paenibacillus tarimensis]